MVKKCIFAIAVLALLATTAQAVHYGAGAIKSDFDWPWVYKELPICDIPVYLEVGHFVQLEKCDEREIHLKQVDCIEDRAFPCYKGCTEISARANFPAVFGASLYKGGGDDDGITEVLTDTLVTWPGGKTIVGSIDAWEILTVCLEAWNVEVWKVAEPADKLKVGVLTINVKPPDTDG